MWKKLNHRPIAFLPNSLSRSVTPIESQPQYRDEHSMIDCIGQSSIGESLNIAMSSLVPPDLPGELQDTISYSAR